MQRYIPLIVIYIAVLALLVLMDHYPLLGYVLDHIALLSVLYVGLRWNEFIGMLFGLLIGLTVVSLVGGPINLGLLVFVAAGWLVATTPQFLDTTAMITQLFLVLIFTLTAQFLFPWLYLGELPPMETLRIVTSLISALVLAGLLFSRADRWFSPPRSTHAGMLSLHSSHTTDETS